MLCLPSGPVRSPLFSHNVAYPQFLAEREPAKLPKGGQSDGMERPALARRR
jgi:hypothetical protein